LVSQVVLVVAGLGGDSLVQIFAVDSVFATFAAITLFFFHSGAAKQYKTLTSADAQQLLFDVEQIGERDQDGEEDEEETDD
jgi:nitrogen fixation-related uncharacterized protein